MGWGDAELPPVFSAKPGNLYPHRRKIYLLPEGKPVKIVNFLAAEPEPHDLPTATPLPRFKCATKLRGAR